jgi:hypothetical protein
LAAASPSKENIGILGRSSADPKSERKQLWHES